MSLIHETMVKEETEKLYKTRFMCIFNTGAKTLIKNKDLLGFLSFGQQYQKYMCIKKKWIIVFEVYSTDKGRLRKVYQDF